MKKAPYIPDTLTPIQNLLCGFAGVAIPRTILAPIDTMKLIAGNNEGHLMPSLKKRVVEQGIPSLWNGVICDWIRLPPQFILRYLIAENLKNMSPFKIPAFLEDTIASAAAVAAIHPIEVVHSLMQFDPVKYPTLPKTAAHIIQTDGFSGFFRGLAPTLIGYIPYRSVQYSSILLFDKIANNPRYNFKNSYYTDVVLSVLVSTVAQASSYPFEVVRKRMMCDPKVQGMTFTQICKETYQKRGILGFYDSFGIAIARVLPIMWMQQIATREFRHFVAVFNYEMRKHRF
ncbi:Mitochondrial carrier protein [Tritrichomonas foetus]|uniref:Mitochondrial carrier protein n=1 Tax=Tritrichomonas foetus TaxID=1144522 RepID=A0A1J4K225_9EUKA|nr:Mitochondrial carrier protein [Tritrichomonas foetus]|eukprot:OHT03796.1 Mitochondrial carrier protein [Tritrichomonas foetus]